MHQFCTFVAVAAFALELFGVQAKVSWVALGLLALTLALLVF